MPDTAYSPRPSAGVSTSLEPAVLIRIIIPGFLLIVCCLAIVYIGDLRTGFFPLATFLPAGMVEYFDLTDALLLFWIPFFAAFAAYGYAVWDQIWSGYEVRSSHLSHSRLLLYILVVAALCRILLLFSPPTLSDDVYRYLWDPWQG